METRQTNDQGNRDGESMIAILRDPHTYLAVAGSALPGTTDCIHVCETHTSWIALVGAYAYKVKKPVRFDFLDYSTLDRRRDACEIELRINRYWAPALYIGVSTLVNTGSGYRFDARGMPVEYAVRMHRFDHREQLDELVASNSVTAAELADLGRRVAELHLTARGLAPELPPDLPLIDIIRNTIADPLPGDTAVPVQALRHWVDRQWTSVAPRLQFRRETGRVRECHGDLHCGNVVRYNGALMPFDGIDFSESLRYIDVACDVAFLAMDLSCLGRPDLAMSFLSAWLEHSRDYDCASALPLFLAYRALVRARIKRVRAAQTRANEAGPLAREAENYLRHAYRYATRPTGLLVLMHGLSGSGKSVVAESLVTALPGIRVRSDVVRRITAGAHAAPNHAVTTHDRYTADAIDRTYDELERITRQLLMGGFSVIVDATFLEPAHRAAFGALATAAGTRCAIVSCCASLDTLRQRLRDRRNDPSEADLAVLEQQIAGARPLTDAELRITITVTTDGRTDVAALGRRIAAALPLQCMPAAGVP